MEACEKALEFCPMLGYTDGSPTQLVIRAQEDGFRSGWRAALKWVLKYRVDLEMGDWAIIEKELEEKMKEREYPCPKCDTGELFDANAGGMFCSDIQCDNSNCDYDNTASDMCGCVTA